MKKYVFFAIFSFVVTIAHSQNQIRIRGGALSTSTSVSEYNRGLSYFYYDSVTLDTKTTSPFVNVDIDIDLGKRFFLTTGLGYSEKGIPSVYYNNGGYWYAANQQYLGMNFQLKYHYKIKEKKFGVYAAAGFRSDVAVGGPNNAEIAIVNGSEYFQAFGQFNPIDFSLYTIVGLSYKLGPGDIILEANFMNGLSEVFSDQFVVGRTFSIGAAVGYSFYL